MAKTFEEALADLIDAYIESGTPAEDIISALELTLMAKKEEN